MKLYCTFATAFLIILVSTSIVYAETSGDIVLIKRSVSPEAGIEYSVIATNKGEPTYGVVRISLHDTGRCLIDRSEKLADNLTAECSGSLGKDSAKGFCYYPSVDAGSQFLQSGDKLNFNLKIRAEKGVEFGTYYINTHFITLDGVVFKGCEEFRAEETIVPLFINVFVIFLILVVLVYILLRFVISRIY